MAGKGLFGETGVLDFVLLDELSENALYNNLVQRYKSDFIYVRKQKNKIYSKKKKKSCKKIFFSTSISIEIQMEIYLLFN